MWLLKIVAVIAVMVMVALVVLGGVGIGLGLYSLAGSFGFTGTVPALISGSVGQIVLSALVSAFTD